MADERFVMDSLNTNESWIRELQATKQGMACTGVDSQLAASVNHLTSPS